jgi:DNA-binding NarL/FixJ family response regulator
VIRLLLVDDHASTREPLAFMLEQEPDLTVVAQSGSLEEGRQALAEHGDEILGPPGALPEA